MLYFYVDSSNTIPIYFRLMGKSNIVYTGVAVKYGEHICKFTETTEVFFGNYDDKQIQAYVDTGEPL